MFKKMFLGIMYLFDYSQIYLGVRLTICQICD